MNSGTCMHTGRGRWCLKVPNLPVDGTKTKTHDRTRTCMLWCSSDQKHRIFFLVHSAWGEKLSESGPHGCVHARAADHHQHFIFSILWVPHLSRTSSLRYPSTSRRHACHQGEIPSPACAAKDGGAACKVNVHGWLCKQVCCWRTVAE